MTSDGSLLMQMHDLNAQMIKTKRVLRVAVFSAVEYAVDTENLSLSAIRTIRVLRPLRAINRIPSEYLLHTCPCANLNKNKIALMLASCLKKHQSFPHALCSTGFRSVISFLCLLSPFGPKIVFNPSC